MSGIWSDDTLRLFRAPVQYEVWTHSSPDIDDDPAECIAVIPKDDFARACKIAEAEHMGADVLRVQHNKRLGPLDCLPEQERIYIVSYCGASPFWWLPGTHGGGMHQIGSAGFCWTCLQPDRDFATAEDYRGLIRHPVTPEEVLRGERAYRCFVCGAGQNKGALEPHKDVDHTVIWGEEYRPRCKDCGRAYQYATPEGIDYEPHAPNCPAMA